MVVCQQSLSLSPVLSLIGFFHSSDMQNEKLLFRFVNFPGKPQPKVEDVKPTKDKATAAKTGTKKEDTSDSDGSEDDDDDSGSDSEDVSILITRGVLLCYLPESLCFLPRDHSLQILPSSCFPVISISWIVSRTWTI